jgi:hypothetical protein
LLQLVFETLFVFGRRFIGKTADCCASVYLIESAQQAAGQERTRRLQNPASSRR